MNQRKRMFGQVAPARAGLARIEFFGVELGVGEEVPNVKLPKIYNSGLVTIGECSVIPDGVRVGKNTAISGVTTNEDYPDGLLPSGGIIIKAGDVE